MIGNVRYAHGRREERGKGEKEKGGVCKIN